MVAYDQNPPEIFSDLDLLGGLQWPLEDISRPAETNLPIEAGSLTRSAIPVTESNQATPVLQGDPEQEDQVIGINWQDDQTLDPMKHCQETILLKVELASYKVGAGAGYDSSIDLPMRLESMANAYYENFQHQKKLDNVSKAILCYTHAIFLTPPGDPKLPARLERLGVLHIVRFQNAREPLPQDYQQAAICINRAFSLAPESQSDPIRRLNLIALIHEGRFWRTGDPVEGTKAIQYKFEILSNTKQSSPELPSLFESLGILHEALFRRTGEMTHIMRAIEYLIQMVDLMPNHPRGLEGLGIAYRTRSMYLGLSVLDDIREALVYMQRAVDRTPSDNKDYPRRLANLGVTYEARFRYLGDLLDNERAINLKTQAVAHTAEDDPDLPTRLESLGVSHETRFQRLGQLDDIETAIAHLKTAVDLTPPHDIGFPRRLDNLGICHMALFEHVHHQEDAKKSIEYLTCAVKHMPNDHPELPRLLSNLGMAYKSRYERSHDKSDRGDIHDAIEHITRAINITVLLNDKHPDLSLRFDNLGVCYRVGFDPNAKIGLDYLEKAIQCGYDAVEYTPNDHVAKAKRLNNLGISYKTRYERTKRFEHLSEALDCFRKACQIDIAPPHERFKSARHWATLLSTRSSASSAVGCLEAYQTAIDLVPDLVLLGANTRQRFHDLHHVRDLGVEAASIAIREGKNDLALEWLEQTRCVVWNQTLLLRSEAPLDQLRSIHPDFNSTDRLQEVINQLYHSSLQVDSFRMRFRASSTDNTPHSLLRSQLSTEYHRIISQVRELPGFKDFLRPKRASELTCSAKSGPIVVLNCHSSGCDALIIKPGSDDITSVALRNYTFEKAQSSYLKMKRTLVARGRLPRGAKKARLPNQPVPDQPDQFEDVLASLWEDVVKPVLETLKCLDRDPTDKLPHITWCPTGIMTFLPLHAAGDYSSRTQPKVFDYVISSYTPTLTALLSCNPYTFNNDCGIIAVGQSDANSHPELRLGLLPGTNRELELVKNRTQGKLVYSQLVGSDATQERVLEAMSQNNWVHLACHAQQDSNDPAKSGFLLHGSTLDLLAIARRLFNNKGLASCMLVAGYPTVVASMWFVMDEDAPLVADSVYHHLMNDRSITNGEVARALHYAVAALRERVGMTSFDLWVQYIHMGL